ncbi:hypothetical protein BH09BAC1_BH09BAC1_14410 [soil metagenome]
MPINQITNSQSTIIKLAKLMSQKKLFEGLKNWDRLRIFAFLKRIE